MRRLVVLTIAVMLTICCGSAPSGPSATATNPSASPMVHVFGSVIDYRSGAGVAKATIAFYTPPLDATAATVVADDSGFYTVLLPPGTYNPRINGSSTDKNAGTIVAVGSQYLANYFVNGGDCVLYYGTVRDSATGQPIAGATVSFTGSTSTGSDGSYRIDLGCPAPTTTGFPRFGSGTIFMTVSGPGYLSRQPYLTRLEFISGLKRIDVTLDAVR